MYTATPCIILSRYMELEGSFYWQRGFNSSYCNQSFESKKSSGWRGEMRERMMKQIWWQNLCCFLGNGSYTMWEADIHFGKRLLLLQNTVHRRTQDSLKSYGCMPFSGGGFTGGFKAVGSLTFSLKYEIDFRLSFSNKCNSIVPIQNNTLMSAYST